MEFETELYLLIISILLALLVGIIEGGVDPIKQNV